MATKNGLIELDLDNTANFPELLNYTLKKIDAGISEPYRAVLDGEDIFKVDTKLNKTVLEDLYKLTVIFPSKSSNATKLVVDNCEAVNIIKPNKSSKKVKEGEVCNLIYDEEKQVFLCASGGVDDVNFSTSDLLTGKSANNSDGEKVDGAMKNNGTLSATIDINGTYLIPAGYTSGGKVTQNIATLGATTYTPTTTDITIPSRKYLSGAQTIKGDANLIAANILKGINIFGVAGSVTLESLGGRKVITGYTTSNVVNVGFKPKILILQGTAHHWCSSKGSDSLPYVYIYIEGEFSLKAIKEAHGSSVVSGSLAFYSQIDTTVVTDTGFIWRGNYYESGSSSGSNPTTYSEAYDYYCVG